MAYPEITWDDVMNTAVDIADDLAELTLAQQDLILNLVNARITKSRYITDIDTFTARRFLAAHAATKAITPPAGEGTRSSETIGSISTGVTLAVNNPTPQNGILETQYGRDFWSWMQSRYMAFYVG